MVRIVQRWPVLSVCVALVVLLRVWPHEALSQRFPQSTVVESVDGEILRVTLAADDQYRVWTPVERIAPEVGKAFQLKEDRYFYWHPGVNPVSLVRAGFRSYGGGIRQGGSTLTMQLARLMYRLNTRSPWGKFKQAGLAVWLELRFSKREILEAYLNLVPFGGNVQGVGAASRVYFSKGPERISLGEALTLAVIPQSPTKRVSQEASLLRARRALGELWLQRWWVWGDREAERRQVELEVRAKAEHGMPQLAPHFVDALLAQQGRRGGRLETSLDAGLQRVVERQIRGFVGQYGERGIRNVSALLVDHRDMSVRAWVGSSDFRDASIDGQVNGVLAKRSPGSTLKPFVYALAMDQGLLHPQTILKDAPTSFGPYSPENFDGRFFGPITAEQALIRSRNVPAAGVASRLRRPSLYQFLQSAGVSRMESEEHYGLALALGGGELTMEELVGLYAMLANGGELRPVETLRKRRKVEGVRLLSAEASFVTLDMLSKNPAPDGVGDLMSRGRWTVAWKTGTSWGFRDAWSVGVVGPYVLAVWIGNFGGEGNPSFVGVDAAAPLFFRIVDALNLARPNEEVPVRKVPEGVKRIAVCAASGELPNVHCPSTVETWYLPGKSPIRVSQLHRAVAVDVGSGRPVCPPFAAENVRWEVFEFWSSDVLKQFREAGLPRRRAPEMPDCLNGAQGEAPKIASPLRGVSYELRRSKGGEAIALEAAVAGDVQDLFWFDGNALIGKVGVREGALGWRPEAEGAHLIRVIDDHGRSAERDVQVRFGR